MRNRLILLFGIAAAPILAQPDTGTLSVTIRDKSSGEVVPAMICITSPADNTWRVPPDGRLPAGYVTNPNFIMGRLKGPDWVMGTEKTWAPGDIGPVVLMAGKFADDPTEGKVPYMQSKRKRNLWYDGKPAIPFWKEPAAYFVSKPFTITLPPGKWRLAVMRGIEYTPVSEEFTVTAGQKLARNIQMVRWVEMAKQGWYSGDLHIHSPRGATPAQDQFVTTWAKAMEIHMTGVHSYSDFRNDDGSLQACYGKESRYHEGDYWLESGAEDPREGINEQGHVTQLNIQKHIRDVSRYRLYDYVFDEVHKQGGMIGYTHLAWSGPFFRRTTPGAQPGWDAAINIIRGKVDFLDILESTHLGTEHFYDFLNLGVKLTAMSDSDCPAAVVGESRTYAYTGPGKFDVDTYYAAMKKGSTFVTNGPMLQLTVGKAIPGDDVAVHKNAKVHIHAQAWAPASIGSPKILEVVSHGRVIRTVEARSEQQGKLTADFDMPVAESQWIAARTTAFNGSVAHTSPVYIIVDGASFVDRAQAPQLVAKWLKVLDYIEQKRLTDAKYTKSWAPGEVEQLKLRIQDARAKYQAVLQTR